MWKITSHYGFTAVNVLLIKDFTDGFFQRGNTMSVKHSAAKMLWWKWFLSKVRINDVQQGHQGRFFRKIIYYFFLLNPTDFISWTALLSSAIVLLKAKLAAGVRRYEKRNRPSSMGLLWKYSLENFWHVLTFRSLLFSTLHNWCVWKLGPWTFSLPFFKGTKKHFIECTKAPSLTHHPRRFSGKIFSLLHENNNYDFGEYFKRVTCRIHDTVAGTFLLNDFSFREISIIKMCFSARLSLSY